MLHGVLTVPPLFASVALGRPPGESLRSSATLLLVRRCMDATLTTVGLACAAGAMIGVELGNFFNRPLVGFAAVGAGIGFLVGGYLTSVIVI
jgi:uncharacterized membrane protein